MTFSPTTLFYTIIITVTDRIETSTTEAAELDDITTDWSKTNDTTPPFDIVPEDTEEPSTDTLTVEPVDTTTGFYLINHYSLFLLYLHPVLLLVQTIFHGTQCLVLTWV